MIPNLKRWQLLLLNKVEPSSQGEIRVKRIMVASIAALGSKVVSALVMWISVPLALTYLGDERNGVWVVITSMLAAAGAADLGFGNSALNALAEAFAKDDQPRIRRILATSMGLLLCAGLLLFSTMVPAIAWIDWSQMLSTKECDNAEIRSALWAAAGLTVLNMPLSLLPKILNAAQLGQKASLVNMIGTIMSFIGLLSCLWLHGGLLGLVLAVQGALTVVWAGAGIWVLWKWRPELRPDWWTDFDRHSAAQLWHDGWKFFILQMGGVLNLQIDAFLISCRASASEVTPYNTAQKLFMFAAMVQTISFPYFWSAFAEARAHKDHVWMKRILIKGSFFSVLLTLLLALPLALAAQPISDWWLRGNPAGLPDVALVWWSFAWVIVAATMPVAASVLNAHGRLAGQLVYLSVTALANVTLSIWWIPQYGPTGAVAASVISFSLCTVIPMWREALHSLNWAQDLNAVTTTRLH